MYFQLVFSFPIPVLAVLFNQGFVNQCWGSFNNALLTFEPTTASVPATAPSQRQIDHTAESEWLSRSRLAQSEV